MKKIFVFAMCFYSALSAFAQNKPGAKKDAPAVIYNENFEKGAELFQLNKPEEAIPFFEKVIDEDGVNPDAYVFLGVAYYQIGNFEKSLAVCAKGLAKENTDHKILAYNAGNSAYSLGNYMRADSCYAIAMKIDEKFSPAVLNRANAQLKLDHLEDAKNNYQKYLELEPETDQREKIELLIAKLEEEIELRARQKPELINPDDFVDSKKMEIPELPEKVDETDGKLFDKNVEEEEKVESESVSAEDVFAPVLPPEQKTIEDKSPAPERSVGDRVVEDSSAPSLPENPEDKKDQNNMPEASAVSEEKSESEKVDRKTVLEDIPEASGVKNEGAAVPSEKLDTGSIEAEIKRLGESDRNGKQADSGSNGSAEKVDEGTVKLPLYKKETRKDSGQLEKVYEETDDVREAPVSENAGASETDAMTAKAAGAVAPEAAVPAE